MADARQQERTPQAEVRYANLSKAQGHPPHGFIGARALRQQLQTPGDIGGRRGSYDEAELSAAQTPKLSSSTSAQSSRGSNCAFSACPPNDQRSSHGDALPTSEALFSSPHAQHHHGQPPQAEQQSQRASAQPMAHGHDDAGGAGGGSSDKERQHVRLRHPGLERMERMRRPPTKTSNSLWGEKVGVIQAPSAKTSNGWHEVVDKNGTKIAGTWKDGLLNGRAKLLFASGACFEGDFKEGLMDGTGTWKGARGESYDGQWCNSYTHGRGRFTWPDGNEYYGEWHWGVMWGQGRFTRHFPGDLKEIYWGQFAAGLRHGNGVIKQPSGDVQHAVWYFDQKWITYSQSYANGDIYSRNGATKISLTSPMDEVKGAFAADECGASPMSGVPLAQGCVQAPITLEAPEKPAPPPRPVATLSGLDLVRCSITQSD
eukprot:CAMPEP_0174924916 /NCGR_PEP_ID=MMETSP1355-20121228/7568_1 /TAXON_ID=464990 /ORGANISM="Hemiselmis tepida, Strain CCMP443" /LENGTH=428 /DNA_ID=CAMNT_0016170775 /DNA_START=94 /DNA_END=1377 /DNA_ORIENTATION=-